MATYKVDLNVIEEITNTRTEYINADSKQEAQQKVLGWAKKSLVDNEKIDIVDVEVNSVEKQAPDWESDIGYNRQA